MTSVNPNAWQRNFIPYVWTFSAFRPATSTNLILNLGQGVATGNLGSESYSSFLSDLGIPSNVNITGLHFDFLAVPTSPNKGA